MGSLAVIDWTIVAAYLVATLLVGAWVSRSAGRSLESYFLADRALPWWWLGTSMAATTFAADTPLVVSGLVAKHGVAGNWLWWSWAISHVSVAVVFAALWRRSRVLTDAELLELRYCGRSGAWLRGFKAAFFAILINAIILGWVVRAMVKIAAPFVDWTAWLGADAVASFAAIWPDALLIGTPGDTLTVVVLFCLIGAYSSLGGIRGVILTDLLQFCMALAGGVLFAWLAVDHVGGLAGLREGLARHYDVPQLLAFVPAADAAWLPLQVFLVYVAVQWWAQYYSDGSGYLAQRIFTARDERHAVGGALWFAVLNYAVRSWPWVLVALVALVVFPLGMAGEGAAAIVAEDREMAYPVLMAQLLPAGALGLLFASLLAAFMSTVDTHLNWGASYLTHDLYRRFLHPDASQARLVWVSRVSVALLTVMGVLVASQIDSIEQAWRFFIALGAGLGLPSMLRWFWWRANAWTEIAGIVSAVVSSVLLYRGFPQVRAEYLLLAIVGISTSSALLATFLTPPVPREHLAAFTRRVRPPGWWRDLPDAAPRRSLAWLGLAWLAGNTGVFALMFGIGSLLLGTPVVGAILVIVGGASLVATLWSSGRYRKASGLD